MYNGTDTVKETLRKLRSGEKQTIRAMYQYFFPKIRQFVLQNSGSESDAKDLFQECIFYLYRYTQNTSFEVQNLDAYFMNMVRNRWYHQLRVRKREFEAIDRIEGEEERADDFQYYAYLKAFSLLGNDCKQVLEYYINGVPMKLVAEKLKTSVDYAKRKKYLCKEQLKKLALEMLNRYD